jgi:hypothetical protein
MKIWLEGDKDCCEPEIECRFVPRFTARVEVNEPAHSHLDGLIDIASTCGGARAVGAIAVGTNPRPTVSFSVGASVGPTGPAASAGIQVTTEFPSEKDEFERTFAGNSVALPVNADVAIVSIVTSTNIDVLADAHAFNWYAKAKAHLSGADPGVFLTGKCKGAACPTIELKYTTGYVI